MNFIELLASLHNHQEEIKKRIKEEPTCNCNFCKEEDEAESPFEIDREAFEDEFRKLPFWVQELKDYKRFAMSLKADLCGLLACLRLAESWNILSPEQLKLLIKLQNDHSDMFEEIMQDERDFNEHVSREGEE